MFYSRCFFVPLKPTCLAVFGFEPEMKRYKLDNKLYYKENYNEEYNEKEGDTLKNIVKSSKMQYKGTVEYGTTE